MSLRMSPMRTAGSKLHSPRGGSGAEPATPVLLELSELRAGQYFGELAILSEGQSPTSHTRGKGLHTASVVASEESDVVLLELNRHELFRPSVAGGEAVREAMIAYAERYYSDYQSDDAVRAQIREQGKWDELKRAAKKEASSMASPPKEVARWPPR